MFMARLSCSRNCMQDSANGRLYISRPCVQALLAVRLVAPPKRRVALFTYAHTALKLQLQYAVGKAGLCKPCC